MTDPVANTPVANTPTTPVPEPHTHKEVAKSFDEWLDATGNLFGALTHAASKALTKNDEIREKESAIHYIMHDKKVSYEEALRLYEDFLAFRKANADPSSLEQTALDPYKNYK